MSVLDKDKENRTEATEVLTLEDLELDVTESPMEFTATLHFEFKDIFNAIEHIEQEPDEVETETQDEVHDETQDEVHDETQDELEAEPQDEIHGDSGEDAQEETVQEPEMPDESIEPEEMTESETLAEPESSEEPETPVEPESLEEPETPAEPESPEEPETPAESESSEELETVEAEETAQNLSKPEKKKFAGLKNQDAGMKKLVLTVCVLFVIIVASIVVGLAAANSLVDDANVANEQKIAEKQANIKEVNLADSIYNIAADKVVNDVAVPTYTLEELYALDLRKKTGFTAEDLKMITRKGLVGCEEAFAKAEETYGVNSIFLISIASLESAHGTMMFRPNNMFGYGRTGFSSKEECIMTVAKGLGTRYLPPGGSLYGGSPTLKGVNKRYAANPQWYYKVGKYMQGYYAELASEKNRALDKFE